MGRCSGRYTRKSSRRLKTSNGLKTSVKNILRASIWDVPWGYIEDHTGTCTELLLGTSSGSPWGVILPSGVIVSELRYIFKLNYH